MRIAIMQPYLFPYLGYFQLMNCADKFFLLDDVNYIKRGWINRNSILLNGNPHRFTLPLEKISQNKKISDMVIAADSGWKKKFVTTIYNAYHLSPYFSAMNGLINDIIFNDEKRLSVFLQNSLERVSGYIGIDTPISPLSASNARSDLKGQERILEICRQEKASEYVNLPGGKALYDQAAFAARSVRLSFITPQLPLYPQIHQTSFLPGLSVIDVLMNNSRDRVYEMVNQYDIEAGKDNADV